MYTLLETKAIILIRQIEKEISNGMIVPNSLVLMANDFRTLQYQLDSKKAKEFESLLDKAPANGLLLKK